MGLKPLPVRWADPAEEQIDRLLYSLEAENPDVARKLWSRAMEAIETAALFPEVATFIPELGRSFRVILSVRPFRIIYRVEKGCLRILAVMRQEQDFDPARFLKER